MSDVKEAGVTPEGWKRYHNSIAVAYNGGIVYLDHLLVDPIRELWNAGIGTQFSCQGGWVEYDTGELKRYVSGYLTLEHGSDPWQAADILGWQQGRFILSEEREHLGWHFLWYDLNKLTEKYDK